MSVTLKVTGIPDRTPEPSPLEQGLPGRVQIKEAIRIDRSRAGSTPQALAGLAPDDVVEIELQDGLRLWSRVDDLRHDLTRRAERGSADGVIEIPPELAIGPASRSGGKWAIKALKVLGLDVEEEIASFAASQVEGRLVPGAGLYRCVETDASRLLPASSLEGSGPALLFLHGTASSTSGSFNGLWSPDSGSQIRQLFEAYQGRVLAYQHRTLTQSPIENALALGKDLVNLLGSGAELHVVSHSRGGLVGELLARSMRIGAAPFTPDELAMFEAAGRERDRQAIEALNDLLQRAELKLSRFVRVACPARGTTLADRRLDRYVSILVNLAGLIPGLRGNPVYEGLTSLLAGVLKKRTDPEELPGLEAMMPTSPLIRMLNNPDVATAADLHVLGGDLAGAGIFGRLKTLVTDLYYRDDHDVVVNTPAMLGGTERSGPIRYWIDTGDKVTHFHYFARTDTARRLTAALTGRSTEFRTLEARPSVVTAKDYVKRAAVSRPVVVVLPGIMGSLLAVDDRPTWMNLLALAKGGLGSLALSGTGTVKVTGLVADGYASLCEHLEATHDVVRFPYDWRRSLKASAEELRRMLDELLPLAERAKQPIRLLAHSMGGLVVRAMLSTDEGKATWTRMCKHPGARFIMLGTPNRGSFAIPAMLMGRDALVRKLALVDLRSTHAELLATIAGFEGVLDLLPHDGEHDFYDPSVWDMLLREDAPETRGLFGSGVESSKSAGFRWALPDPKALEAARQMSQAIGRSRLDPTRVIYVAGTADETASHVVIDRAAPAGRRVRILATRRGDGRVLWDTGIPEDVPVYYMDTVHGDMANDRRHFSAILDLLDGGSTTRLSRTPPVSRAADEVTELREPMPAMVPDEAELVSAALGGSRRRLEEGAPVTRIQVRLVHDNLTNARHPVLVSHYKQDVIVAAEKYLDDRLGGRLSELLRLELYPGPINTAVVVLNDPQPGHLAVHPGAIVAGLGMVGELTPGALASTLTHALTVYGAERVGFERRRQQRFAQPPGGSISLGLTAILVGSGEGGVTLGDSVRALLRAVIAANGRLRAATGSSETSGSILAQIDQVDIFELYEDRAIEAMYALRALTASPEFSAYSLEPLLVKGKEGLRRARYGQAAGWWQRVRITTEGTGELKFEAITQQARAAGSLRPTQRTVVDRFVQQALETTTSNTRLGHTLFELLVPNDFKSYAPERQKLSLLLDPDAASFPWELMQDGFDPVGEPLSVSGGMVRQLLIDESRGRVLRASQNTALVVGNPIVADRRFPPLPGARDEAMAVAALLGESGDYEVDLLLEGSAKPVAVLTAVHEKAWRILHLAAHGVFEHALPDGRLVSGLVLDDGVFFTAAEAEQLRHVPELVFINCCHLGQTRGDAAPRVAFHRLAANLATQFIRMGARAVVAAGWAVNDAAAKTFANAFYTAMLQGAYYGDAVLQARRDTFRLHGHTNTWGAYQCYGDPSFSLKVGPSARTQARFVSQTELGLWLESQRKRARGESAKSADLLAELIAVERDVPAAWFDSADICALTADAFAALGQYERAIAYFDRVVSAEEACAPISAIEQLANARARWAMALAQGGPDGMEAAHAQLDEAERLLRRLLEIGETSERRSLVGGVMKRRAELAGTSGTRREALRRMSEEYARAYELSMGERQTGNPYPLANWIAAEVVLNFAEPDASRTRAIRKMLKMLEAAERALAETHTDAFNLVGRAERSLMSALADGDLDDEGSRRIELEFASGLSRGATEQQRDSIRTQFRFFRTMLGNELPEDRRAPLIGRLTTLEERVLGQGTR